MPEAAHRVLYVDDNEDNRVVFQHSFSSRFAVETASSGEEALEIVRRSPPEVVVTDQRMPGMSGIDLLEQVRQINPKIRRLMITAFDDAETKRHNGLGTCGCIESHFMKPFDHAKVEAAIVEVPSLEEIAERAEKMLAMTVRSFEAVFAADECRRRETEKIAAEIAEKVTSR